MALFGKRHKTASPTGAESWSDEEIIRRILDDGEQLLEVLYDRYATKIYHKCLSITKDSEASKDCTHDIMLKVFLNLSNYKGKSAFSLWVHSITYNYCMDYLQKQKKTDYRDYADGDYDHLTNDDDALEHKILKDVQLTQLETAFEILEPNEKIVLMMRYQDGMSIRDISEALNIGESAIKMRLKRSRDRLAEILEDLDKEQM
jgi:RNA polymerase sigma factor (sigma-70 family)